MTCGRYSRADRARRELTPFRGLAGAALLGLLAAEASPHEIPTDVVVQAFLKPAGAHLHLLVRVPLSAMRDVAPPLSESGLLDLARAEGALRHAASLWIADEIELYEGGTRLSLPRMAALRVSLASDRSFASYPEALAHLGAPPLPDDTVVPWNQSLLDIHLEYRIQAETSPFSIRPRLARLGLRVVTALRFLPPGGALRAFELRGDPGLVPMDPRWHQAALRFVEMGFLHILEGTDHLLFLLCLVIPYRKLRGLVYVVTAFTAAHSITLVASAFGLAPRAQWFPPLVETLIAASIVVMALENIIAPAPRRHTAIAFGFGLVHGFGFSFALRETLQFAGGHLLTSLLSFNLGVELGQVLVLVFLVPALHLLFRWSVVGERLGTVVLSALVAHTGWHWTIDRGDRLLQIPFLWPTWTAALGASALRWLMLAVGLAGLAWLVFGVLLRSPRDGGRGEAGTW